MNEDIPGDVIIRKDITEVHRKGEFYFRPGGPVGFAAHPSGNVVFTLGPLISDFYPPAAARAIAEGLLRMAKEAEQRGEQRG